MNETTIEPTPVSLALRRALAGVFRPPPRDGCTKLTKRCDFWNWGGQHLRPPCCTSHLLELTDFVHGLLARRGIVHWLDYGSLLGAVRSGELIPWDPDVDFGVLRGDLPAIRALAPEVVEAGCYLDASDSFGVIRICYSAINEQHVDLFPWTEAEGTLESDFPAEYDWPGMHRQVAFPRRYIDDAEPVLLHGRELPAPSPVHQFLAEHRYGPDYMTPTRPAISVDMPAIRPGDVTPAVSDLLERAVERDCLLHDLKARRRLARFYIWRNLTGAGLPDPPASTYVARVESSVPQGERTDVAHALIQSVASLEQAIDELERPSLGSRAARLRRWLASLVAVASQKVQSALARLRPGRAPSSTGTGDRIDGRP